MSFSIATQHLRTLSTEISLVSQNVASSDIANNEEILLAKESVIVGSTPQGIKIRGFINNVDQILQKGIYTKISENAYNNEIAEVDKFINSLMGQPGESDDLSTDLVEIFNELHKLAQNPENVGLKRVMVDKINSYANKISEVAYQLENKRLQIDGQIVNAITTINQKLENTQNLKNLVFTSIDGSLEYIESDRKFRASLEELSEFIPIQPIISSSGEPQVFLATGQTVVGNARYFLKYDGVSSLDQLVLDEELPPLYLSSLDKTGNDTQQDSTIVTGGVTADRRTNLDKGQLAALIHIRDKKIPNLLGQLDLLAKRLKDSFNELHNEGSGFPPPTSLRGTTLVSRGDYIAMQGKARIAVLNTAGEPVSGIDRLTIDFDKLDTGEGAGRAVLQGVINEINYHFGERNVNQSRVEVGNIKDIKLTSITPAMEANEDFVMDFDLHNFSTTDATFNVTAVTATDGNGDPLTIAISGSAMTVDNDGNTRSSYGSGPKLTISNPSAINYPYSIDVTMTVNDGTTLSTATVTYVIDNPVNDDTVGLMNKRFAPSAVSGDGALVNPTQNNNGINVAMVLGDEVLGSSDTRKGALSMTAGSTNWGILIDNGTSIHGGLSLENIQATNNKFSYQFGLNDLFQRRDNISYWGNTKNTAFYMKVRDDIVGNASFFAGAKAIEYIDYDNEGVPQHGYKVSAGDFDNGHAIYEIKNQQFYFPDSGGLSSRTQSLNSYAAAMVSHSSLQANNSQSRFEISDSSLKVFKERFDNAKGVNVNDQMIKMMELINASSAQNKIIGIMQKFFDTLFSVI